MKAPLFLVSLVVAPWLVAAEPPAAPIPPEVQTLLDEAARRGPGEIVLDRKDPLAAAWHLARQISGDPDAACWQQFRCVQAMAEAGKTHEAAAKAQEIADYRSALGSLNCAEACLDARDEKRALELVRRAEQGMDSFKPWQQQVLQVRMAAIGAQAGWDDARVDECLRDLEFEGDRFGARMLVQVRRMLRNNAYDLAALRKCLEERPQKKAPVPELVEAAQLLLRLAPPPSEKAGDGLLSGLMTGFDELLRQSESHSGQAWLKRAAFWHARGDKDQATAALTRAQQQTGWHLDGAGEMYHQMALLWDLRGSKDAVRPFFEALEAKARALLPMYRPAALAWLGACCHVLGEEARHDVLMNEALQEAAANENPRMRLIGCVEICLCHARTGRPLSEELVTGLRSVLVGSPVAAR
ncbi:MAG: hypothetical protein HS117_25620 [Verrucomicrobiaceae bacterium]|jgi:hypothetical protein|nr:hypothetical protein [Verrucomicrobiaceae bacterium]